ncbi:J domain-containing protein [Paenibacillus tyrfis]|uniref:J domain-containing protein n=1 Tax=Paenibacillus tyrfis TaxID=1501230 RepID=UPI0020A131F0|nr:J domain-containing protein [Paenibacillus tyrfis]MCP1305795.1 tetratricopeptide repeat protein [Paenibacillus tyrfis]
MQIWNILDIQPTNDLSVIKKAYARKLKQHHPEDDPEGYQRLREAYDQAVRAAKRNIKLDSFRDFTEEAAAEREESGQSDPGQDEQKEEDKPVVIPSRMLFAESGYEEREEAGQPVVVPSRMLFAEPTPIVRTAEQRLNEFMEKVTLMYRDIAQRIEIDSWLKLLNDDIMWDVKLQREVRQQMTVFLNRNPHLPRDIWQLLESSFCLKERVRDDRESFSRQFPNVFLHVFADPYYATSLRFSFLTKAGGIDCEAFLRYRLGALLALKHNHMEQAEEMLNRAYELFPDDPDLLRLQAEYFLRLGSLSRALTAIDRSMALTPDDPELCWYRARIYVKSNRLTEAIHDVKYFLSLNPGHLGALSLAAKCYTKLGDPASARDMYLRLLELQPDDIEALVCLAEGAHPETGPTSLPASPAEHAASRLPEQQAGVNKSSFFSIKNLPLILVLGWFFLFLIRMLFR